MHSSAPVAGLRDWLHLWKSKQDVFTDKDVNLNLLTYLGDMLPSGVSAPGATATSSLSSGTEDNSPPSVLVPLCGRTKDLVWLANKGYLVVGIEAIAEPLLQWAEVNGGLEPIGETEKVTSYRSPRFPNLNVIHGNVFDVTDDMFGDLRFDAVWDRAGITSLHDEERPEYLRELQQQRGRGKLAFTHAGMPHATPKTLCPLSASRRAVQASCTPGCGPAAA